MKPLPPQASFGDLLRQIIVFEKQQPVQPVAAALGITAHAFFSRLRNGGHFDPDEVAILLRMIGNERVPQWFFSGSGLLLVRNSIAPSGGSNLTLRQRTASCAATAISTICDLADMLESYQLERLQKAMIEERLDHAFAALLSIKRQLALPEDVHDATPDRDPHEDFAKLVGRVLLTDKAIRLGALADALNLSYQALHARMLGQVAFLPVELRQLFRMFPDPRLADYLLTGTAYTAIIRPAVIESRIDGSPIATGLLSLREMVHFLEALLLNEDTPDADLPATTDRHLDEAVRQLATLRWNMTYIGRRGVARAGTILPQGAEAA
jgi:hypothetical protein